MTLSTTYYNNWQHSYTFETADRISTSGDIFNVGRDADVYIGVTHNAVVEDAIAVRVIVLSPCHIGGSLCCSLHLLLYSFKTQLQYFFKRKINLFLKEKRVLLDSFISELCHQFAPSRM